MDYEINERIKFLRKRLKLSQVEFANSLGVSRGVIQNIDDKVTYPKNHIIKLICKVHNVNESWLSFGELPVFYNSSAEKPNVIDNIASRVRLVRQSLNLTQSEFGESIGVGKGVIVNIELCRVDPKPLLLQQICKMHNVNPKWLETGEGDMFLPVSEEEELLAYAEHIVHNKDLNWIKQLNLTLMSMTPEELAVMEKFALTWLDNMKKEQE